MRMMKETGDGSEVRCLLLSGSTCCSHPSGTDDLMQKTTTTTSSTTTTTTTSTTNPEVVKKHQHKHNLKHRYEVMETLGKGTYGTVKKAVERSTRNIVAIKSIRKERVTEDLDRVHIQRELEITASLRHPNIIRFFEVFEGRDKIVIVMEYASRGELYDYVQQQRRLTEPQARGIFRQITSAVHYCHKNGVVHRDLKLENILLDGDLNVKLADFGLSNRYQKHSHLQTFCGSPLYASPEIVRGLPYLGPEVDCWALGVLLYALVYGSMPFDAQSHATLMQQITQGRYHKPNPPSDACALIDWLLAVRADERATVEDVANHWWVNWGYDQSVCDCPSAPHQDCPSPLLARYIDWQTRVAASNNASSSSLSQPSPHPISFSFPLKGERGCGGAATAADGSGRPTSSSLRKSRKENAIPQTAPCGAPSVPAVVTPIAAAASVSSSSTTERRKPKGILKPQRSFDSSSFLLSPGKNAPSGPDADAGRHTRGQARVDTEAPPPAGLAAAPPAVFSQPSFKMPKKGILKNLCTRECGYYSSSPDTGGMGGSLPGNIYRQSSCDAAVSADRGSPDAAAAMRAEAVRRRKGILKRNGKFSRSLDLPDEWQATTTTTTRSDHDPPSVFPGTLQRLLAQTGPGSFGSRPSSAVSEDSLFSSDSFDLLDLSVQSHGPIFSPRGCSSEEEDLGELGTGTDALAVVVVAAEAESGGCQDLGAGRR